MDFPAGDNGDALRRLYEDGANFSILHDINYQVVFPIKLKKKAKKFSELAVAQGFKSTLNHDLELNEILCICSVEQMLDHDLIVTTENMLSRLCGKFGGEVVGWGTFG